MKILIQDCETHQYFNPDEGWVPDAAHGLAFESSVQALLTMRENQLDHSQIVLMFDNPYFDFVAAKSSGC